jgi:fused signal recognition particle receptor
MGLFDKFKYSLAKTRAAIVSKFVSPLWDPQEMERGLLAGDFGPRLSGQIIEGVRRRLETTVQPTTQQAIQAAKDEIESLLTSERPLSLPEPSIILMVGVNGAGKTTTTAKLGKKFKNGGGTVLLAAADTFRAAAIEQLKTWGSRLGLEVVAGNYGADPGAVAHDAVKRLQSGGFRYLLVDTAGRQHTKSNLMQELQKVKRVVSKAMPGAPHETWLVVDAPTGGNAVVQAREFHSALELTGIVITKLDGSAKGGFAVGIRQETGLPIRYIGLGEGEDDLEPFDPKAYAEGLWSE